MSKKAWVSLAVFLNAGWVLADSPAYEKGTKSFDKRKPKQSDEPISRRRPQGVQEKPKQGQAKKEDKVRAILDEVKKYRESWRSLKEEKWHSCESFPKELEKAERISQKNAGEHQLADWEMMKQTSPDGKREDFICIADRWFKVGAWWVRNIDIGEGLSDIRLILKAKDEFATAYYRIPASAIEALPKDRVSDLYKSAWLELDLLDGIITRDPALPILVNRSKVRALAFSPKGEMSAELIGAAWLALRTRDFDVADTFIADDRMIAAAVKWAWGVELKGIGYVYFRAFASLIRVSGDLDVIESYKDASRDEPGPKLNVADLKKIADSLGPSPK